MTPHGLPEVLARIKNACDAAHRDPKDVQLLAITKSRSVQDIQDHILTHGTYPLGENRVQEARDKMTALPNATWHLVGHLQRNKVKFCQDFAMIHSVDSVALLTEIARHANTWGHAPTLLLEVNIAQEPQKHGLAPNDTAPALHTAKELGLNVRGLMTVAPQDPTRARAAFADLRSMRDSLGLVELSMGMSDDLHDAILHGATIVRVGRALFGNA